MVTAAAFATKRAGISAFGVGTAVATRERMRIESFLLTGAMLASAVGCAGTMDGVAEAEANATDPASLDFKLTVDEFKRVDNSDTKSFEVEGAAAKALPCRNRAFSLVSKPSLRDGWDPAKADAFLESVPGSANREYIFASCRDAEREVLAWYGKERRFEFNVGEQMRQKDYDPKKVPLLLRLRTIGNSAATHYACDSAPARKPIKDTEDATRVELSYTCKKTAAPSKGVSGPIDFMSDPGPFAAVASFSDWMLPAVQSDERNFAKARDALFKMIGEGTYTGAMKDLDNVCELTIKKTGDALIIDHTTKSSNRLRHLELTAKDLLGFAEGDLFKNNLRVEGPKVGTFVAAEFQDKKGDSFNLRFEANDGLDKQIVRIDRSTFCRRLEKK